MAAGDWTLALLSFLVLLMLLRPKSRSYGVDKERIVMALQERGFDSGMARQVIAILLEQRK